MPGRDHSAMRGETRADFCRSRSAARSAIRWAGRTALLASLLLTACIGPRTVREEIVDMPDLQITLRGDVQGGEPVHTSFEHPASISALRLSNILASIQIRDGGGDEKTREPAFPAGSIFEIAKGLEEAFTKAKPGQEIVVTSKQRVRSLLVFTGDEITSFIAFMQGDRLHIHLYRVGWKQPKNPNLKVREPRLGEEVMSFRVLAGHGIVRTGNQSVAVNWRDSFFRDAAALTLGSGGRVQRRTILLEEPPEQAPEAVPDLTMNGLSPDTLRRLADLEEERREGDLPEFEYETRKRAILAADPANRP